jgi:hypothetical protein
MDPLTASTAVATPAIDLFLTELATSKVFNGMMMLIMNVGGKYLPMELPQNLDKLFVNFKFMRYLVIFALCFMATRDVKMALFLALILIIVFKFVMNESSMFCLVKKEMFENIEKEKKKKEESEPKKVSKEEYDKAKEIVHSYLMDHHSEFSPHHSLRILN